MRVVHLSTLDLCGGAARSAYRIHSAQRKAGIDSRLTCLRKTARDPSVYGLKGWAGRAAHSAARRLAAAQNYFENVSPLGPWSNNGQQLVRSEFLNADHVDIVNLHWVAGGAWDVRELEGLRMPVVWTLHDMWPFTGGCHYAAECAGYKVDCGRCPQLQNDVSGFARRNLRTKCTIYRKTISHVISPSRWMDRCVAASQAFTGIAHGVIPYPLDAGVFRPLDQRQARISLGLDVAPDERVLLFGASEIDTVDRKGVGLCQAVLAQLSRLPSAKKYHVVTFGGDSGQYFRPQAMIGRVSHLGGVRDDCKLAQVYAAADLFLMTSRQDNYPNTVCESLACGTPVIGFGVGGVLDLIQHGETGFLVQPFCTEEMAAAIARYLADRAAHPAFRAAAADWAGKTFNPEQIGAAYREAYTKVLASTERDCGVI